MSTTETHLLWQADKPEPERYSSDVGGDNQVSDVWFVRLVNSVNRSTVSINVYVAGFPDQGNDGKFDETGIEICIEWDEWLDFERTKEGYQELTFEPGSALSYPADDESVRDLFEHSCKRIAREYIRNAKRDIWWDGRSQVNT